MTTATLRFSSAHSVAINWKAVFVAGLFTVGCLWIFYTLAVNQLTGGAYSVKTYEDMINSLSQENRQLEVTFAESGFLGDVQQKVRELNFEKTSEIKYIQVSDNSIASNIK